MEDLLAAARGRRTCDIFTVVLSGFIWERSGHKTEQTFRSKVNFSSKRKEKSKEMMRKRKKINKERYR